jgi:hypothetical protein
MLDKRNLHLKVQELCDCYAGTDHLKEMCLVPKDEDPGEGALKWIALAVLHGVDANADKIRIASSDDGHVSVPRERDRPKGHRSRPTDRPLREGQGEGAPRARHPKRQPGTPGRGQAEGRGGVGHAEVPEVAGISSTRKSSSQSRFGAVKRLASSTENLARNASAASRSIWT